MGLGLFQGPQTTFTFQGTVRKALAAGPKKSLLVNLMGAIKKVSET